MILGRSHLWKTFIAVSLFLNGLAIGSAALWLMPASTPSIAESNLAEPVRSNHSTVGKRQHSATAIAEPDLLDPAAGASQVTAQETANQAPAIAHNPQQTSAMRVGFAPDQTGNANAIDEQPLPVDLARMFSAADKLLGAGAFQRAQLIYNEIADIEVNYRASELQLRQAICHEMLGEYQRAVHVYQLVADESMHPQLRSLAQVGIARSWLKHGESKIAKHQLWHLFLNADEHQTRPSPASEAIKAEVLFLLAESLLGEREQHQRLPIFSQQRIVNNPISATSASFVAIVIDPQTIESLELSPTQADTSLSFPSVNNFGEQIPQVVVNQQLKTVSLQVSGITKYALLQSIAHESGFALHMSAEAMSQTQQAYTEVQGEQIKLDMLLDGLLLAEDLVWTIQENDLYVTTPAESAWVVDQAYLLATQRLLRYATLMFPEHSCAASAKFALANTMFWNDQAAIAIEHYQNLLRDPQLKPQLSLIRFNLAIGNLSLGNLPEAEKWLRQVCDNGLHSQVTMPANLHLGVIELERGNSSEAIRAFSRALAGARGRDEQNLATIVLSIAYLEQKNPFAAIKTIEHARSLFTEKSQIARANLIVTFARQQASKEENGEIARALLNATGNVSPTDFPGLIGFQLLAKCYSVLQLMPARHQILEAAQNSEVTSSLRDRLALQLADSYADIGKDEQAIETWQQIATRGSMELKIQARTAQARLYVHREEYEAAIDCCRQAIAVDEELQHKTVLLQLLGEIFQRQGNFATAAICFAGLIPTFEP